MTKLEQVEAIVSASDSICVISNGKMQNLSRKEREDYQKKVTTFLFRQLQGRKIDHKDIIEQLEERLYYKFKFWKKTTHKYNGIKISNEDNAEITLYKDKEGFLNA